MNLWRRGSLWLRHVLARGRPGQWLMLILFLGFGAALAQHGSIPLIAREPVTFSIVGPPRMIIGQLIILELVVENRSRETLTVVKPSLRGFSLQGKVNGPDRKFELRTPIGGGSKDPSPIVTLAPGESVREQLGLTEYLYTILPSGEVKATPGRYSVTMRYESLPREEHGTPSWMGGLGPTSFTFDLSREGLPSEENALATLVRSQENSLERSKREAAFDRRTRSLERLLDRYPKSVLLLLAFGLWEKEGRYLEQAADVERICSQIRSNREVSPGLQKQAAATLVMLAWERGEWAELAKLRQQVEGSTREVADFFLNNREMARQPVTLRADEERREREEKDRHQRRYRGPGRRTAEIWKLEEERRARLRALEIRAAKLPKAPDEERGLVAETEIQRRVEGAIKRGEVHDGMRFDENMPLESRQSYADKLRIRNLEQILEARQKWLPDHRRREEARRKWLEERPEDPMLAARDQVMDKEAELAPLTDAERRKLEADRQRALADGDISTAEYQRLVSVLRAIEAARKD
jgi:hypothetical protein